MKDLSDEENDNKNDEGVNEDAGKVDNESEFEDQPVDEPTSIIPPVRLQGQNVAPEPASPVYGDYHTTSTQPQSFMPRNDKGSGKIVNNLTAKGKTVLIAFIVLLVIYSLSLFSTVSSLRTQNKDYEAKLSVITSELDTTKRSLDKANKDLKDNKRSYDYNGSTDSWNVGGLKGEKLSNAMKILKSHGSDYTLVLLTDDGKQPINYANWTVSKVDVSDKTLTLTLTHDTNPTADFEDAGGNALDKVKNWFDN